MVADRRPASARRSLERKRLLRLAALRDIAKDDHHSDELIAIVQDRRSGKLDRIFLAGTADERK